MCNFTIVPIFKYIHVIITVTIIATNSITTIIPYSPTPISVSVHTLYKAQKLPAPQLTTLVFTTQLITLRTPTSTSSQYQHSIIPTTASTNFSITIKAIFCVNTNYLYSPKVGFLLEYSIYHFNVVGVVC